MRTNLTRSLALAATCAVWVAALLSAYVVAAQLDANSTAQVAQARAEVRRAQTLVSTYREDMGTVALSAWRQGQAALLQARPGSEEAVELLRACEARGVAR